MIKEPKVAVIVPTFNSGSFVSYTIESVLKQTHQNWELIIVDDCSTDNTINILSTYENIDNRIKIYNRNRYPKGACTCRNIGIEKTDAEFLMFLDSDDLLAEHCLSTRVSQFINGNDFAIFQGLLFDEKINDLNLLWNIENKEVSDLKRQLHLDAIGCSTSFFFRRDSFLKLNMWNENLTMWQDVEIYIKAYARNYSYSKHLDLPPDFYIRKRNDSLSRGNYNSLNKIESRLEVLKIAFKELKDNNKKKYIKELKFMGFSIVNSYINSREFYKAKTLIKWLIINRIFSQNELNYFKFKKFILLTKTSRIFKGYMIKKELSYSIKSSIGKYSMNES